MSEQQEESSVVTVTSETRAEFMAQRMGNAEAEDVEPVVEAVEAEPAAEEADNEPSDDAQDDDDAQDEMPPEGTKQGGKVVWKGKWVDRSSPSYRIHVKTQEAKTANEAAAAERASRIALEQRLQALEGKPADKPAVATVAESDKPSPAQFEDAFEYAEALAVWAGKQALIERDKQEQEKVAKEAQEKVLSTWQARQSAVKEEIPDYDDMLASSKVMVSDPVRDAILKSDAGPRILYHLAENEEFAVKLGKMSVQDALVHIGRLEAKFEKAPENTEKKPEKPKAVASRAPAPISPINGSNSDPGSRVDPTTGEYTGSYQQFKADYKAGKIK